MERYCRIGATSAISRRKSTRIDLSILDKRCELLGVEQLGHGGDDSLVKRVYGHLGGVRYRAEAVEYRVNRHKNQLRPKLELLKSA